MIWALNRADKAVILDPYQSPGWEPTEDLNRTDVVMSIFILKQQRYTVFQNVFDPLFYTDHEFKITLQNENVTASS